MKKYIKFYISDKSKVVHDIGFTDSDDYRNPLSPNQLYMRFSVRGILNRDRNKDSKLIRQLYNFIVDEMKHEQLGEFIDKLN